MQVFPFFKFFAFALNRSLLWPQIGVAIAYYAAAKFSINFTTIPAASSTPVWLAAGVAVGALLVWGLPLWLGVFTSIFILNFGFYEAWTLPGFALTLGLSTVATSGKVLAAYWTQTLTAHRPLLDRPLDVIRFVIAGSFLSHLPVGVICAALVCSSGRAPWAAYSTVFLNWWLGDAFGILIMAPLIVAWGKNTTRLIAGLKERWLEVLVVLFLVLAISRVAFGSQYPLEYTLIPLIVWAAFRFQQPGATLLMAILSISAMIGTAQGYGSFAKAALNESLLLLQSFIGVIALTTLLLGAVLAENEQARVALRQANTTLEERVYERTSQLTQANAEIASLNTRLQAENWLMGAKLDIVRQIQQMILPKVDELEAIADLDIASFMEAADDVGGDYYDILQTDGVVTISIGDVTGHGLESGILMLMTQTAVRTLTELRETDAVKFIDTLNRTLYKNIRRINTYKNLTLVILNYLDGKLSISGQHEETIVVRASGSVERIDTLDLGFPLGIEFDITSFIDSKVIELHPGDGIVLYTDGITEAMNASQELYGIDRLCVLVSQNWSRSSVEIQQAAIADLRQHLGNEKVLDDITLLVLKRRTAD